MPDGERVKIELVEDYENISVIDPNGDDLARFSTDGYMVADCCAWKCPARFMVYVNDNPYIGEKILATEATKLLFNDGVKLFLRSKKQKYTMITTIYSKRNLFFYENLPHEIVSTSNNWELMDKRRSNDGPWMVYAWKWIGGK